MKETSSSKPISSSHSVSSSKSELSYNSYCSFPSICSVASNALTSSSNQSKRQKITHDPIPQKNIVEVNTNLESEVPALLRDTNNKQAELTHAPILLLQKISTDKKAPETVEVNTNLESQVHTPLFSGNDTQSDFAYNTLINNILPDFNDFPNQKITVVESVFDYFKKNNQNNPVFNNPEIWFGILSELKNTPHISDDANIRLNIADGKTNSDTSLNVTIGELKGFFNCFKLPNNINNNSEDFLENLDVGKPYYKILDQKSNSHFTSLVIEQIPTSTQNAKPYKISYINSLSTPPEIKTAYFSKFTIYSELERIKQLSSQKPLFNATSNCELPPNVTSNMITQGYQNDNQSFTPFSQDTNACHQICLMNLLKYYTKNKIVKAVDDKQNESQKRKEQESIKKNDQKSIKKNDQKSIKKNAPSKKRKSTPPQVHTPPQVDIMEMLKKLSSTTTVIPQAILQKGVSKNDIQYLEIFLDEILNTRRKDLKYIDLNEIGLEKISKTLISLSKIPELQKGMIAAPNKILEEVTQRMYSYIFLETQLKDVGNNIANFSYALASNGLPISSENLLERLPKEKLEALLNNTDPKVRSNLANSKGIIYFPQEIQKKLIHDPSEEVQCVLAKNRMLYKLKPDLLQDLYNTVTKNNNPKVLKNLAYNHVVCKEFNKSKIEEFRNYINNSQNDLNYSEELPKCEEALKRDAIKSQLSIFLATSEYSEVSNALATNPWASSLADETLLKLTQKDAVYELIKHSELASMNREIIEPILTVRLPNDPKMMNSLLCNSSLNYIIGVKTHKDPYSKKDLYWTKELYKPKQFIDDILDTKNPTMIANLINNEALFYSAKNYIAPKITNLEDPEIWSALGKNHLSFYENTKDNTFTEKEKNKIEQKVLEKIRDDNYLEMRINLATTQFFTHWNPQIVSQIRNDPHPKVREALRSYKNR